ncbi:transposase (plasmid) [Thermus thermophilus]|nr:transposase [Thermus thermophilus]BCZ90313.1 transposase [Thermus thermophilus]BCZ90367.1 transposase [Thermus thermophilus]BCZ90489.1 transposase [Thermus thermophilus]
MKALKGAYPLRLLSRVLRVPRSTLYYRPQDPPPEEAALRERLRALAAAWPRYGYRRLTALLRGEGVQVGEKRVRSLMREEGLLLPRKGPSPRTTFPGGLPPEGVKNLLPGLAVTRPHQVWVADLSYVVLGEGVAYLAVVMDLHTRKVLGVALGPRLSQGLALAALEMALREGCPEVHHSDRGVQYTSRAYVERLLGLGVRLSYAGTGRPWENGHAERLIRTIKEEWVALREYRTLAEARASVKAFVLEVYNRKRPHSALGYLTPEAFSESLLKGGGSPD